MFFSSIAEAVCQLIPIDLVIELAAQKHGHSTSDDKDGVLQNFTIICRQHSFYPKQ